MAQPAVSIVIPAYNSARFLEATVESCLRQDYRPLEIVVVNDGSADNTREIMASFGSTIVCVEQENKGPSAARNAGIRAASGEYIATLDADDLMLPGRITAQSRILSENPDVVLVGSDAIIFSENGIHGLASKWYRTPKHPEDFGAESVDFFPLVGTVTFRRAAALAIGGFNESLRRGGAEDWLFVACLSLQGRMVYQPFPTVMYRRHSSNNSNDDAVQAAGSRQASALLVRWARFSEFPAAFRSKAFLNEWACTWRQGSRVESVGALLKGLCCWPFSAPYAAVLVRRSIARMRRRASSPYDVGI